MGKSLDLGGNLNLLSELFEPHGAELHEREYDEKDPRALDIFKPFDGKSVEFGLLGVPYDGAVKGRRGAEGGPNGIREALRFNTTYSYDRAVDVSGVSSADFGNVVIPDGSVREVHTQVTSAVSELMDKSKIPMLMGGDHSLSYAHLKAFCERIGGKVGIITFDSHNDLREYENEDISSGTPFRRILEELDGNPVAGKNIVQIGLHGFLNSSYYRDYAISKGMMLLTTDVVRSMGMENIIKGALLQAGDGTDAIFLSVDMASVDQSEAPGVSAPSPGGLSAVELLNGVYEAARDNRVKGMDLVEVAPSLDPTGNTARLGANVLMNFIGGKAKSDE